MVYRTDGGFGAVSSAQFDAFGETQPLSFDFNLSSAYEKPSFRSAPRISFNRPPYHVPFDNTSVTSLILGATIIAGLATIYLLGKSTKWWK